MNWSVYILHCSDGSYYIGYSNDVENRLDLHNSGRGAKYTRSRRPCEVVYTEQFPTRNEALKRECQLKQWTRAEKQALIDENSQEG